MAAAAVDGEDNCSPFDRVRTAEATSPVRLGDARQHATGDRLPRRQPILLVAPPPVVVISGLGMSPVIAAVKYYESTMASQEHEGRGCAAGGPARTSKPCADSWKLRAERSTSHGAQTSLDRRLRLSRGCSPKRRAVSQHPFFF
jgi:hypothetical protein